ncbi:methylated-DNA--[protein]-cysteine S-methyltransferase [Nonomuraea turkmeniaca]|uniref:methylated-DNA--[protein]-cysteine S-methyltransferase n=1 Tax=Nonomuraea turkmeniaca TaxID=103838 RepID=A0A5S4FNE1_9ACTN|nr:methylated-DNA--[protein]-cysteine S-methyltransferase [Nonomuraea turkmeniaca]TMR10651.1 methylated-DNA--[protein]-cysteine S-methyltransferase [Nonomuraea turkmeniaca]
MTENRTPAGGTGDRLLAGLAGLAADAPDGLLDRIAARWVSVPGPIGELRVAFTDQGVAYVHAGDGFAEAFRARFGRPLLPAGARTRPPAGLLPALRTGRAAGLRLDLRGMSDFQRDVLETARTIPRGEVRPYAWIAARIGRPKAVRAVGTALANNPVPLLLPCHRVTRSDGAAGEYVFGTPAKERLLLAEGVDLERLRRLAGERVFYLASDTTGIVCFPTCHNARRIAPAHRHGFRTLALARAAGYRPCRTCRPAQGLASQASGPGSGLGGM